MKSIHLAVLAGFSLSSTLTFAAEQKIKVCNRSDEEVVLAVAEGESRTWVSTGWYAIPMGECVAKRVSGEVYIYTVAVSSRNTHRDPGDELRSFCVDYYGIEDREEFRFYGTNCGQEGITRRFKKMGKWDGTLSYAVYSQRQPSP